MSNTRRAHTIAAILLILALVAGYRWSTSDERAIRRQLSEIAQALTVAPTEGSLGPVTRIARLRKALAPEIRVSASPPAIVNEAWPNQSPGASRLSPG